MLQDIRDRSTGWIAKAIVGVIVVLLSFTGFEAIMSSTSNRNNAAKVNGAEISLDALAQEKSTQLRQLQQQFGTDFDTSLLDDKLINEMALKSLINRKLLLQAANQAGFAGSSAVVDRFILQFPEFQEEGQFSSERFDQVLRQMGYGRMQFRQMLEQDMLVAQLQGGIAASAFATPQEASRMAALDRQERDFSMQVISPALAEVEVSSADIEAYYQSNPGNYMSPERVVLDYIELSKLALAADIDVADDELQNAYSAAIANLDEQRRAAHILFEIEQGEDQARKAAETALERLQQGEDFAALAEELSDDIGSASEGGDLGFAGRDIYEPAFEEALYALEKDQLSGLVRTRYGIHIIKLLDVNAADVPSLDQLRDSLLTELRANKVEQRFVELVDDLERSAYESADLQQPAQELGLTVKQSPELGREGGEGIFANRKVIEAAFSEELLEEGANSHALELDADTVVVVRVQAHHKPELLPLSEVSERIEVNLKLDKAAQQSREQGEALLAALRSGEQPELDWQSFTAVSRMDDEQDPEVLQQVFRMPRPAAEQAVYAGLSQADGSYVVLQLNAVSTAEDALGETGLAAYQEVLGSRSGQVELESMARQFELDAKIERF